MHLIADPAVKSDLEKMHEQNRNLAEALNAQDSTPDESEVEVFPELSLEILYTGALETYINDLPPNLAHEIPGVSNTLTPGTYTLLQCHEEQVQDRWCNDLCRWQRRVEMRNLTAQARNAQNAPPPELISAEHLAWAEIHRRRAERAERTLVRRLWEHVRREWPWNIQLYAQAWDEQNRYWNEYHEPEEEEEEDYSEGYSEMEDDQSLYDPDEYSDVEDDQSLYDPEEDFDVEDDQASIQHGQEPPHSSQSTRKTNSTHDHQAALQQWQQDERKLSDEIEKRSLAANKKRVQHLYNKKEQERRTAFEQWQDSERKLSDELEKRSLATNKKRVQHLYNKEEEREHRTASDQWQESERKLTQEIENRSTASNKNRVDHLHHRQEREQKKERQQQQEQWQEGERRLSEELERRSVAALRARVSHLHEQEEQGQQEDERQEERRRQLEHAAIQSPPATPQSARAILHDERVHQQRGKLQFGTLIPQNPKRSRERSGTFNPESHKTKRHRGR
ncbi:hypothetical protein BLS_001615 [Venturia inaequalis]|uniref:Uncharacterized protein n=1 Tax=Venturia inaequalis TaxID=5025 RepID=A0A8H3Z1B9_VENIN|nr:hypothetical protein EG328_006643 [Venturia inaequalis]KAE9977157.1 hypothetical protein BLS_001615 [Venturia inaequalis]KAE9994678.1 hypothetical protein EG327_005124 [Venturia inaequalis]RDI80003.1 hypothetical protein Vi05172_g9971 [Venturia inaequalis]